MKLKRILKKKNIIWFLVGMGIVSSCSTEKNTFITRTYHNVTSHYNIFFNGNESYKKGLEKLHDSYIYDYTRILPVFKYTDEQSKGSIIGDMDRTQKKALKVIQLHSISAKPEYKRSPLTPKQKEFLKKKEYNKWIDDNYLLIGKAHFYKRDLVLAMETFRFMLREFPEEPVKYDALLWMAKTHIELEEYKDALEVLNLLDSEKKFPERLQAGLDATYADYFIKQENYSSAIPRLEKALEETKSKDRKIRFTYILAQLNQKAGNDSEAYDYFTRVVKMNPPYEMAFNAQINLAGSFTSDVGDSREIIAMLEKMLKDDKNIEYQDQIYYAIGEIYLKENNEEEAINYFKKSVRASLSNNFQKAQSYLSMADLYYARPEYKLAQAYYDSAVVFLDEDFPNYNIIYNKSVSLNELVGNLNMVELQDSVQRLALLPEEKRIEIIDLIIKELEKKEQEERELERERMQDLQYSRNMSSTNQRMQTGESGKWYFYNLAAKSFGQSEFKMKWGNRKLEDNWRRKNKKIVSVEELAELSEEEGTNGKKKVTDKKSREFYLQNIPLTDSAMAESHEKIKESLMNAGLIYKNDLKDYDDAILTFEEVIERYPESDASVSALYNLYTLYTALKSPKASEYKSRIITEYPESLYTKVLTNPDYFKELEKEEKKVSNFYTETLNYFNGGNFTRAISNADFALNQYADDELIPKFIYLKALSMNEMKNMSGFRENLSLLMDKYPNEEVTQNASLILQKLDEAHPEIKAEEDKEIAREIYKESNNQRHYLAMVINKNTTDLNQLIFNIINFNLDYFDKLNLTVESEDLTSREKIVTVESFENSTDCLNYYGEFINMPEIIFKDIPSDGSETFVISSSNYSTLLEDKSLSRYMEFFNSTYLQ